MSMTRWQMIDFVEKIWDFDKTCGNISNMVPDLLGGVDVDLNFKVLVDILKNMEDGEFEHYKKKHFFVE